MDESQYNIALNAASDAITFMFAFITDNEYLHKSKDGNVYLHNVETMTSSLYLSNSTFVRCHPKIYIRFHEMN